MRVHTLLIQSICRLKENEFGSKFLHIWFNFKCNWTPFKQVCLNQEIKQIWWNFFSLSLSLGRKRKRILPRHLDQRSNGLFWELIARAEHLQLHGPLSKLKVILILCMENDSSKGKVLQHVANFCRSWKKFFLKELVLNSTKLAGSWKVQDFSLLMLSSP